MSSRSVRAPRARRQPAFGPSKQSNLTISPRKSFQDRRGGFRFRTQLRPADSTPHRYWPTVVCVSQLSFFSAESVPPAVADLTGILAAPGQVVLVGTGARLSVVVDRLWRAEGLAEMISEAGLQPEITHTDDNTPLVRTTADPRLLAIARDWTRCRSASDPFGSKKANMLARRRSRSDRRNATGVEADGVAGTRTAAGPSA